MTLHRQLSGGRPSIDRDGACLRRVVTSLELMGDACELIIQHAGEEYRLRITRHEKLILTK